MTTAHVYDTYATTAKGRIMHFDVVLYQNNPEIALGYAKQWLQNVGEADAQLTQNNCVFCHSAEPPTAIREEIDQQGYAIVKLEGCPT